MGAVRLILGKYPLRMHSARRHELGVGGYRCVAAGITMHSARRHELGEIVASVHGDSHLDAFRAETWVGSDAQLTLAITLQMHSARRHELGAEQRQ